MKTYSYQDMIKFGINPLTGEACAFSKRVLCDLSEKGVELLSEYFGIKNDAFPENWNSKVGREEAVASVMIDRNAFHDIMIFALMLRGWHYIIVRDYCLITVTNEEYEMQQWQDLNLEGIRILLNYNYSTQPRMGSRNLHHTSGRYL
jgi:hypothetical protein